MKNIFLNKYLMFTLALNMGTIAIIAGQGNKKQQKIVKEINVYTPFNKELKDELTNYIQCLASQLKLEKYKDVTALTGGIQRLQILNLEGPLFEDATKDQIIKFITHYLDSITLNRYEIIMHTPQIGQETKSLSIPFSLLLFKPVSQTAFDRKNRAAQAAGIELDNVKLLNKLSLTYINDTFNVPQGLLAFKSIDQKLLNAAHEACGFKPVGIKQFDIEIVYEGLKFPIEKKTLILKKQGGF
jgi:hypothetical protein